MNAILKEKWIKIQEGQFGPKVPLIQGIKGDIRLIIGHFPTIKRKMDAYFL